MLSLSEGRVRCRLVAEPDSDTDVAARTILPDDGRIWLDCFFNVDDRGQRFVLDFNEFGGVACLHLRFGHDKGNPVAYASHTIVKENGPHSSEAFRTAPCFGHEVRRNTPEIVGDCILARQHA